MAIMLIVRLSFKRMQLLVVENPLIEANVIVCPLLHSVTFGAFLTNREH